ncbi:hypothetical protein FNF29_07792 [Cafeteria roenbergensis]|uniref:Nuclear migration protein nudC n=1 Tax=Cafeteria roenbergensis TaxID=33653 RepID=A0A5A8DKI0_CAFRO|nr:hypothetical protein FNF29_07792 [Cafeteria roenbergensis]KAA0150131.1 hypothetical protein FNF31_07082 [Cafeteria roenbergensis]KAA0164341.1 hypothetical protein FNF28_03881 [Cafeteria roenbergensis]|eukprot:KAA0146816.1 hypothetical protein FNF29_07792 [Cafeteria roenbergensis]
MEDPRVDDMLMAIARQHTRGIDQLLDTFFGFLRRKTDFFSGAGEDRAKKAVLDAMSRQFAAAQRSLAQQAAAKHDEAERLRKRREKDALAKAEAEAAVRARLEAKAAADAKAAAEAAAAAAPAAAAAADEDDVLEPSADGSFDLSAPKKAAPAAAAAAAASSGAKADAPAAKEEGEEAASGEGGIPPSEGNGYSRDLYSWTQTLKEVTITVPVPAGTRGKDLSVSFKPETLSVGLKGAASVLDGPLFAAVAVADCTWTIEDAPASAGGGRLVTVMLAKAYGMAWWPHVVTTEPKLDLSKVEPENSNLGDLDAETRKTVEKMMFDSRQKAMGKPTSDELERQRVLERFMKQHPEMDFSQAKIS